MDEALLRWTVRLSLLALVAGWGLRLGCRPGPARTLSTVGLALMALHVLAAFQFVHGWSHSAAVEATALDTLAVTGRAFGGGVWFNYLFLGLWAADTLWWWLWPSSLERRPAWISVLVYGFLAFIAFNATVVFETGPVRWGGIVACLGMAGLAARRWRPAG